LPGPAVQIDFGKAEIVKGFGFQFYKGFIDRQGPVLNGLQDLFDFTVHHDSPWEKCPA